MQTDVLKGEKQQKQQKQQKQGQSRFIMIWLQVMYKGRN